MASLKTALPIGSAISLLFGLGLQLVLPQEPLVGWALIGLAVALALFWGGMLAARRLSGPVEQGSIVMHNPTFYFDQVKEEIEAVRGREGHATGELPSVVVAPMSGSATVTMAGSATLAPDSATSASTASSPQIFPPTVKAISPLYLGQIIVSAANLAGEEHSLELAVRVFNGSSETLKLESVEGAIHAGIGNSNGVPLPTPTWRPDFSAESIPPGAEFLVVLDQPVPPPLVTDYLLALDEGDYIALDLQNLKVKLCAVDDPALTAPLPLWHGVSIRRRDDIFTGRIIMGSVGIAEEDDHAG